MKLIKTTDSGIIKLLSGVDAVAANTLADMIEVPHKNIMRTVKKVMKYEKDRKSHSSDVSREIIHIPEESSINFNAVFQEWEYKSRGKTFKTYIMNEDALYLVIANMKGQKAHSLKVWYKSEFNKMRDERAARKESIESFRPMTDQLKILQEYLGKEGSGFAPFTYSTINKWIEKQVLVIPNKDGDALEAFTTIKNVKQQLLREAVEKLIHDSLQDGKTGRETKDIVKDFLKSPNPWKDIL